MSKQGSCSGKKARFADLVKGVRPLHSDHSNRTEDNTPKPSALPLETMKDHGRVLEESLDTSLEFEDMQPGDSLSFRNDRVRKNAFRKLKKGQYSIGAELDLHGLTIAEAQLSLVDFIQSSREKNIRCVRIIHGKGHGSSNRGPKLKPMVNRWLQKREEILAFCSARPVDGGTGAVYVLLKSLN
ncbi:MAG: Smr/MutS family protein [Gammaproteobacteria bacterium]|nr:Smr/MutS family protein [Gammaproteobacteria bacterium]